MEIARAIVAAGGRALVASAGGRMEARLQAEGGELVRLPLASKNPLRMRLNASRLKRLARREGVDLIHARSRAPAWSGLWAARAIGTPFVTTYHGAYNEQGRAKRRYNAVMAKGEPVIAVSAFIAEMIQQRYGTPPERIRTIPRGADLSQFSQEAVMPDRIAELVTRWGIEDESRPIFMLPGRLTRWKGQEVFVDACAILRERRGPCFLGLMVGGAGTNAEYAAALDRRILAANVGDCARMTGACSDMPAAYLLSDCVVSASTDPEAFGRVAVEAQAMARPVLASDHGGARETVEHAVTGLLVPPGDATALADAMEEFLDLTEEEHLAVTRAARERAATLFSIERMQEATLDVYEQATGLRFPRRLSRDAPPSMLGA